MITADYALDAFIGFAILFFVAIIGVAIKSNRATKKAARKWGEESFGMLSKNGFSLKASGETLLVFFLGVLILNIFITRGDGDRKYATHVVLEQPSKAEAFLEDFEKVTKGHNAGDFLWHLLEHLKKGA